MFATVVHGCSTHDPAYIVATFAKVASVKIFLVSNNVGEAFLLSLYILHFVHYQRSLIMKPGGSVQHPRVSPEVPVDWVIFALHLAGYLLF